MIVSADRISATNWVPAHNDGPYGRILIVAGFAFQSTPGPRYIIIVIGMWMLVGEFLPLDRVEVRPRELDQ